MAGLLEAIRSDREGTAMLSIRTENGKLDAVVTVHPMRAGDRRTGRAGPAAHPAPVAERFVDPALMRQALLDGTFKRIGGTLDFDQLARELINIARPALLQLGRPAVLESLIGDDELPVDRPDGSHPLRRLAVASDDGGRGLGSHLPDRRDPPLPAGLAVRASAWRPASRS